MLNQMMSSEWLIELTDQQQDLLTAGADSQQNSGNFAQKLAVTNTTNTAGLSGNVSNTNTQTSEIVSGGQSLVSMGGNPNFSGIGALNNLPSGNLPPISNSVGLS